MLDFRSSGCPRRDALGDTLRPLPPLTLLVFRLCALSMRLVPLRPLWRAALSSGTDSRPKRLGSVPPLFFFPPPLLSYQKQYTCLFTVTQQQQQQ